jgi:hypothetical protein
MTDHCNEPVVMLTNIDITDKRRTNYNHEQAGSSIMEKNMKQINSKAFRRAIFSM